MELTVVNAKQSVNLKLRQEEQKRSVRNFDCENNELRNTVGKQITTFGGIRRQLLTDQKSYTLFEES